MRTLLGAAEPARRREHRQQPVDVYLDVDGVIIPVFDSDLGVDLARSGWRDWTEQSARSKRRNGRVRGLTQYSPVMVHRIKRLAALDHVDMWWVTTWGSRAHELAAAIGLPDLPVLDEDDRFRLGEGVTASSWWKRDAVQAHHAQRPDRAVVWIDDDLGFDEKARLWMRSLGRCALGISPDTMVGLSSHEMRKVENFVMH